MLFGDAEQKYRELEKLLYRGELGEEEFIQQVAQLRVVDPEGRRWMLSARTGRWLVHDGQQWVFAEPPRARDESGILPKADAPTALPVAAAAAEETRTQALAQRRQWVAPRFLVAAVATLLLIGCLIGGGVSAWVFLLRDMGKATAEPGDVTHLYMVETYTPRPATATYTPTFTVTPSRTPTATITPTPTRTPLASSTPAPTSTPTPTRTQTPRASTPTQPPTPTASRTSTATNTPLPTAAPTSVPARTYTVKKGDTLSEIAVRFGVTVGDLAKANGITDPALVRVGQVLVIPEPGVTITPTRTAAATTPTATPKTTSAPSKTPAPTKTPTPKAPTLAGKIAYAVWNPAKGKYELYISLIDGTGRNLLGEGFRQPQLRQDGGMIVVNGDGAPNYEHLVFMNPSGGIEREISNFSEDSSPTWSPDGNMIAFSSTAWGDGRTLLGIVHDVNGKGQNWIPYDTTELQGTNPFWMDSGQIAYHGCDFWAGGIACGLYKVASNGGSPQRLTTDPSDNAPAGYGMQVAFMTARDGDWEIFSINLDGSGLKRLTDNSAQDGLPTWSPDGKSIAFVSNRGGVWAIWVMNADGSNERKLFDIGGGYGSGPYDWTTECISWSP